MSSLSDYNSKGNIMLIDRRLSKLLRSRDYALFLQQVIYRYQEKGNNEFYKFLGPCKHEWYKKGDSWQEELEFSSYDVSKCLKALGYKKGSSQNLVDESSALIIYYTDSSRVTWYKINEVAFDALINGLLQLTVIITDTKKRGKLPLSRNGEKYRYLETVKNTDTNINTETTTENTTERSNLLSKKGHKKKDNITTVTPNKELQQADDGHSKEKFEFIWKLFPHARTSKKQETLKHYLSCKYSDDEIIQQINYLLLQIEYGLKDTKYIQAMERWMRDFIKINTSIIDTEVKKLVYKFMEEKDHDLCKKLVNIFGEDKVYIFEKMYNKDFNTVKLKLT